MRSVPPAEPSSRDQTQDWPIHQEDSWHPKQRRVKFEIHMQRTLLVVHRFRLQATAVIARCWSRKPLTAILSAGLLPVGASAQTALTWDQVKDKFAAGNPTLKAAKANIDESRAAEITAYLRPNPDMSFSVDGTQLTPYLGVYRPFAGTQMSPGISYLHEREQKRELRRDQAKENTTIAETTYLDQERNLVFTLRSAFVQVLQSKAILQNAQDNLAYWDGEIDIQNNRLKAGDLAQVDFDRFVLQRVQFESDYETALVNLRTAKISRHGREYRPAFEPSRP